MANAIFKTLLLLMAVMGTASAATSRPSFRGLKKTKKTKCKEAKIELHPSHMIPTRMWITLCYEPGRGAPYKTTASVSRWYIGRVNSHDGIQLEVNKLIRGSFGGNFRGEREYKYSISTYPDKHGRIMTIFKTECLLDGKPTGDNGMVWIEITN